MAKGKVEFVKQGPVAGGAPARLSRRLRWYLFALLLLAPIDYFRPTALVMRELGARPAILLMICAALWLFAQRWRFLVLHTPKSWLSIVLTFIAIGMLGTVAFIINLGFGISYTDGTRSPQVQFVGQFGLFALVPFVLLTHADLFRRPGVVRYMVTHVPVVLAVHLCVIGMEASSLLNPTNLPLMLFRTPEIHEGYRISGLMTEPAYVGVLAGVYAPICVFSPMLPGKTRLWHIPIAACAVVVCLALGAKTIVPVLAVAMFGYVWQRKLSWNSPVVLSALGFIVALALYNVLTYSALNVQENLSSAMRVGSAQLAWNVAKAGYGIGGIGFGQFHFLYNVRYAPSYLMHSEEANVAFSRFTDTRASTYNLFLRYLVETGITGLVLFLHIVWKLLRDSRLKQSFDCTFGTIFFCGSLGFLFTQDPYFFPMFLIGAATLMAISIVPNKRLTSA